MVEINLMRRASDGGYYWMVKVGEKHRLMVEIDVQKLDQSKEIGAAAAMLADEHNRRFGGNYDAAGAEIAAKKAYRKLGENPKVSAAGII